MRTRETRAGAELEVEVTSLFRVLRQAAYALSFASDEQAVRLVTVRAAADALNTPSARFWGVDGAQATVLADYHQRGVEARPGDPDVADHPGVARVMASGEPWAGRLTGSDRPPARVPGLRHQRSGAFAPVSWDGETIAVLAAVANDDREFTYLEVELLLGLADQCALALKAAHRFQLEHQYGERMAGLERAKGQFLNLVSHELRGPLAVINGYLSMLNEGSLGNLSPVAENVVRLLGAKANEMTTLVDDMLEVARLEDSRVELSIERLDLRRVVEQTANGWTPLLPEELTIRIQPQSRPVYVDADATRARTIVTNLVSNAVKYSPSGGLVTCRVDRDGANGRVSVSDQGLGIPPEGLPLLFTRFGRVVTPQTSHIPGTGLGLYVSRELARAQGGELKVDTEPGRGSTFTLTLPLSQSHPA